MNVLTSFLYAFSFWNGSVALKKEGMQNDTHTLEAFHALNEKEHDKIKTIHAMLERRMHYRQTIAKHPADAPALPPEMFDKKKKRPQNDSGVVINTSKEYNKAYHDQGQIKFVDNQKQQQEQNESQVQPEQEQNREKKKKEAEEVEPIPIPIEFPRVPPVFFGLIVVSYSFKNLPSLSEKTKEVATKLYETLVGSNFGRCLRRGTKLLINPSVIEFQETMKELKELPFDNEEAAENTSFFMLLQSHGVRIEKGPNEGSYVMFHESRIFSEQELLLTSIHEKELAEMIHAIPARNKMILLECCQSKEPIENPPGQAETIRNRVKEDFSSKLYDRIVELKFEHLIEKQLQVNVDSKNRLTISNLQTKPELLNTFILDSCLLSKKETPVREKNGVSNFLIRLVDAFRGAGVGNPIPTVAVTGTKKTQQAALRELAKKTEGFDKEASPPNLYALHIAEYIINKVIEDARKETKRLQEEHKKRHKDSSTFSIPIQELTHTPQLIGANYIIDFAVAHTPISASIAPSVPIFNSASLNTMTISWNPPIQPSLPPQMTLKDDVPVILGYHIEYRGNGRACHNNEWKRARAHQVLTYEAVVREGEQPPTTLKVYGLTSDTAYRFRVRARTAGGWGPFSEITPPFRTKSMVLIDDYLSLVTMTATADNPTLVQSVRRIITLMKRRMEVREIQYLSLLQLVKMTTMPDSKNSIDSMIVAFDIDTVQFLIDTMQRFDCDPLLLEQGCRLLGFLAMDGPLRRSMFQLVLPCPFVSLPFSLVASLPEEILNRKKMKLIVFLKQIHTKYQISVPSTSAAAEWALQMFHQLRPKKKLGANAAAMRIQGLYRRKKAQELMRTLAFSVFQRIRDPMSGMTYFYNTKTGESTWTQPKWMV